MFCCCCSKDSKERESFDSEHCDMLLRNDSCFLDRDRAGGS